MPILTKPINVQLEITDKCNFRCRHCYHLDFICPHTSNDQPDDKVIAMAKKIVEAGIFGAVITGGEPLVRKNLAKKIIKYFKQNNVDVSLNTNLQLIDAETLDDFMANGLDSMLISCPAINPDVYSFMTGGGNVTRFLSKLKTIVENKQRFAINMVVNRHNIDYIKETAIGMRDIGVKVFGVTPMGLNLENPDLKNLLTKQQVVSIIEELIWIKDKLSMEVDIFEAIPKCIFPDWILNSNLRFIKRKCQAGKTIISVANNGNIRPCSHNPDVYGNILNDPLERVWERMQVWRTNNIMPNQCVGCTAANKCYGGCRITAKAFTADIRGNDPWMNAPIVAYQNEALNKQNVILYPQTTLHFSKIFHWRKEKDNTYLISSERSGRRAMLVNNQLFGFIKTLRDISPITLNNLIGVAECNFNDADFQRVIKLLASKNIVFLQS